jgi:hypothetical protein
MTEDVARQEFLINTRKYVAAVDRGERSPAEPEVMALLREALKYDGRTSGPAWHPELRKLLNQIPNEAVLYDLPCEAGEELIRIQQEADAEVDRIVEQLSGMRRWEVQGDDTDALIEAWTASTPAEDNARMEFCRKARDYVAEVDEGKRVEPDTEKLALLREAAKHFGRTSGPPCDPELLGLLDQMPDLVLDDGTRSWMRLPRSWRGYRSKLTGWWTV